MFWRSPGPIFGSLLVPAKRFLGSARRSKAVFGSFSHEPSLTLGISGCAKGCHLIFRTIFATIFDGKCAFLHTSAVLRAQKDVA